jgi:hypothetical protein
MAGLVPTPLRSCLPEPTVALGGDLRDRYGVGTNPAILVRLVVLCLSLGSHQQARTVEKEENRLGLPAARYGSSATPSRPTSRPGRQINLANPIELLHDAYIEETLSTYVGVRRDHPVPMIARLVTASHVAQNRGQIKPHIGGENA